MFKFGDHIKTKIDSVFHHGVFVSENEIIHFCSNEAFSILSNDLEIKKTNIAVFAQGNKVEVIGYPKSKRLSVEKSVEKARSKIGNKDYDIIFNNCEHFVNSCITGERQSYTMNSLKERALKIHKNDGINGFIDKLYRTIRR